MTDNNDPNQLNDEANPKDDEDIIDLTDIASGTEDIEFPDYTDEATNASEEEKIAELDDDILENTIKLEDNPDEDIEIDHYLDNEFADSTEADLDSELDVSKDLSLEPEEESYELGQLIADIVEDTQQEGVHEKKTTSDTPESINLSPEQVDEALERVIKKMYADKIDSMLTEVIEKTVTKEIEQLKALLLEDTKIDEE
ncbi:MAG: hypothetical protein KJ550_05085 [Proteobacteria bacterium]|nr:hypothetical protein [Desulfobacteraceae bacterium]MBU4012821.1 hypothetical protein [Pseudomonadota bacterium]MBU4068918.1 hypothetical protein [Pseudomonadota bacterium]MBU4100498.1 hypothetical protein [Pseudomonadota bacterium]MBU4125929.1 hypothetical protein [Pseudomonadota bacterium]